MNKKVIITLTLCGLSLIAGIVSGCNSPVEMIGKQIETSNAKKPYGGRPAIKEIMDYTSDITGEWVWEAVHNEMIVGEGVFSFKEKNEEISGEVISFITGLKKNPLYKELPDIGMMVVSREAKGRRIDDSSIGFNLLDENGNFTGVQNIAKIYENGKLMKGLTVQEQIIGGEPVKIEYKWMAHRQSG